MLYLQIKTSTKVIYIFIEQVLFAFFTLLFMPIGIKHIVVNLEEYFLYSFILTNLGAIFLDKMFSFEYHSNGRDEELITKIQWLCMFVVKIMVYGVVSVASLLVTHNFYLSLYIFMFLILGGWIHFIVLTSHTKHYNEMDRNRKIVIRKK
jgi:hypothetical protein